MRVIFAVLALVAAPVALARSIPDPVVLPTPRFRAPVLRILTDGPQLVLVSSRYRDPGILPPDRPAPPSWAPRAFRGAELDDVARQQRNVFLVYGDRYVVVAKAATQALRYALDVGTFTRPPNRGEVEPVTWVRESEGIVYVSNSHLSTPRRQKDGMRT